MHGDDHMLYDYVDFGRQACVCVGGWMCVEVAVLLCTCMHAAWCIVVWCICLFAGLYGVRFTVHGGVDKDHALELLQSSSWTQSLQGEWCTVTLHGYVKLFDRHVSVCSVSFILYAALYDWICISCFCAACQVLPWAWW
jgi:hypothetical protein